MDSVTSTQGPATIEVPEWMNPEHEYVARWDPIAECWSIAPF